ncbi:hypothetical protein [Mucilaginibacter phyllosphaerae]|uniref:Uncharacterized protein n=1 Tax=Mucilaginibacter phyllosphaerae TaxID=1812349 RepID=A0A4Y8ABD0_9SPHI|nr:hypothetical protein [Mucilaginibacter phyllosphaerae]MBB3969388.1 hypothetical protein [Mucilaginibacter phyllosphaerae]TEW65825.1 hypothetical protein E2R65_11850 [Mucilaginibacter phyllosphaerae]GGH08141.1 hypothetical protein GCM10007352_13180 [Mucilaginibacter phyllosphaerae]
MQTNKYHITLFETYWKEDFLNYDFPLLPSQGDVIEFKNEYELFLIKERGFETFNDNDLIEVTLYGVMEGERDNKNRLKWDRFKERLPKGI